MIRQMRRQKGTSAYCERINAESCRVIDQEERELTVSVEEARTIVLDSVIPLPSERVPLTDAYDRVLHHDIVARMMVPSADDSAMDGYAVIAGDTRGASRNNPARLRIIGEIRAGASIVKKKVSPGEAMRIMTGAPIPEGADSVIRFEDAEEESGYVHVFGESAEHGNCKRAGENIRKGERVLRKGDWLRPADIGILASLNCDAVRVYRRPTVSIISTGDELAEVGEELREGQIRNVNAYTLYAEIKKYNALPRYLGIARDTKRATKEKLLEALEADVVISTGGVSMGRYDLVKKIYADLNIEVLFEWIDVKPGRPCTFGKRGQRSSFLVCRDIPCRLSHLSFNSLGLPCLG